MPADNAIDSRNIGDEVLWEYLSSGLAPTARKFALTPQDIMYYVEITKAKQPERWEKVVKEQEVDVVKKLTKLISRVETKLDKWENDDEKEGKFLLAAREVRDGLKLYVDILEKIMVQRQSIAFRKAVLDVIRSIDPAIAQQIVQRVKELSDLNKVLGI